jgi:phospholipid/cholesterol/gamma-HCH transport system substrate-binding protein
MVVQHAKAKIATLIGFTLVCVLVFVYLFQAAGGHLGFGSRYTVSAVMPTTFNLVPNSDVRAAGVKVGTVDSVTPDGQDARVTFSIDSHTSSFPPIYRNATTQVRIKTLVGESYLSLNPGTPSAGKLPNGGVLPPQQAAQAVPLEQVLGMLDPATRQAVRRDMLGLGVGLDGHGAQLNDLFGSLLPTVTSGNQLLGVLNPERQQVASLIDDSGRVMQALGQRTGQFQSLILDAKATAQAVASRSAEMRQALDELPSTLAQARATVGLLSSFSRRATPVFSNLRAASADLSPAIQQLEPTAADARVLFGSLKPFLVALRPLVSQLGPAASKLNTVVLPLDALLRQADPALSYLSSYSAEFGSFFSNVGAVTDTKDGLGYRGRVFAIGGVNQFTDLTPTARNLVDALVSAGSFGLFTGTRSNPYPKPGTAGDPQPFSGHYDRLQAAP